VTSMPQARRRGDDGGAFAVYIFLWMPYDSWLYLALATSKHGGMLSQQRWALPRGSHTSILLALCPKHGLPRTLCRIVTFSHLNSRLSLRRLRAHQRLQYLCHYRVVYRALKPTPSFKW